jgi:hypothetical protein
VHASCSSINVLLSGGHIRCGDGAAQIAASAACAVCAVQRPQSTTSLVALDDSLAHASRVCACRPHALFKHGELALLDLQIARRLRLRRNQHHQKQNNHNQPQSPRLPR